MKNLLLICAFWALGTTLSAQSNAEYLKKYNSKTIFYGKGNRFILDEKAQKIGSFGKKLKPLLADNESATKELKIYRKKAKTGYFMSLTGVAMTVSGFLLAEKAEKVALPLYFGGIAVGLASLHFSINAPKHLNKSVWLYNRQILFGK
jgi:hypothetical protein